MQNLRTLLNENPRFRERFFSNLTGVNPTNNLVTNSNAGNYLGTYTTECNNTLASILLADPKNHQLRTFLSGFVSHAHRVEIPPNTINLFMHYVGFLSLNHLEKTSLDSEGFRQAFREAYNATELFFSLSVGNSFEAIGIPASSFVESCPAIPNVAEDNLDQVEIHSSKTSDDLNSELNEALDCEK